MRFQDSILRQDEDHLSMSDIPFRSVSQTVTAAMLDFNMASRISLTILLLSSSMPSGSDIIIHKLLQRKIALIKRRSSKLPMIEAPKRHQIAEEVSVAPEGRQIMIRTIPPDTGHGLHPPPGS